MTADGAALLALARTFAEATETGLRVLGRRCCGDRTLFLRLAAGHLCRPDVAERVLLWFSQRWPGEVPWPAQVPRPEVERFVPKPGVEAYRQQSGRL